MRRTLELVIILLAVSTAQAGTRMSIFGGVSTPIEVDGGMASWMGNLGISADAPSAVHRIIPLELTLAATGPYEDGGRPTDRCYGPPYNRHYYLKMTSAGALRICLLGNNDDREALSPVEFGVGLGNHQFWSRGDPIGYGPYQQSTSRWQVKTQWRGHGFLKVNFKPVQHSGPYFEFEYQHVFDNLDSIDGQIGALLAKFGWWFRV